MPTSRISRWLAAAPLALYCIALWTYAGWAYNRAPHDHDLYSIVNHSTRHHQAEGAALYLFGFDAMATACAVLAIYSLTNDADTGTSASRRFRLAVIVMLIFGIGAFTRVQSVRAIYGF
ncbi:MAG: hypothetical protein EOO77_32570 [Oxalobacteraceae bacterium]|nr:MAG: hypothetical protein EOO77_32570 [Oxalobacteraceae bacterium]